MLANYIKLSLRLLARNPFFTFINVFGLSTGFAVFFILWQFSQREMESDQFHDDWKNIVRLTFKVDDQVYHERMPGMHPAFEKQLAQTIPELSQYLRICDQNLFRSSFTGDHGGDVYLTYTNPQGQKVAYPEHKLLYADENLFDFFTIQLITGTKTSVLKEPNSLVLSEKLAKKYFGDANPLNAILLLNDSIPLMVTGVFRDIPFNSHLDFEAVMAMSRVERNFEQVDLADDAWFNAYYKLPPQTDREAVQKKIEEAKVAFLTREFDRFNWDTSNWKADLQPLDKVVFERAKGDSFVARSKLLLYIFSITAVVVLAMAWINYVNLVIARNNKRLKELATRLTVGARAGQLLVQFLVEALAVNLLSLLLALTMIQVIRVPAESLLAITFPQWNDVSPSALLIIAFVLIAGIFVSGFYPFLVAVKQVPNSLFSRSRHRRSPNAMTNVLTILQLMFAVMLVVWVFGIYAQMNHILKKDLGFRKDHVVVVDFPYLQSPDFDSHKQTFLKRISALGGVEDLAISSSVAGDNDPDGGMVLKPSDVSNVVAAGTNGGVDHRFLDFYDIKLLAGRNFLPEYPADDHAIILSQKVIAKLGIVNPSDAIGKIILVEHSGWTLDMRPVEIIGVIEDYRRLPLINRFQAFWSDDFGIALTYGDAVRKEARSRKVSIKVRQERFDRTIKQIEAVYQDHFHGSLFNWYFLDEHINRHYQSEKLTRNQILLFTCLAIGISCLGFLGLISNKAVDKTKEIGIRKVLGAQLHEIAKILLKTSIGHVATACIVGIPVGAFILNKYQERFIDQVELHWWHYISPALILLVIMAATISFTLWKAVRTNPVESLRTE